MGMLPYFAVVRRESMKQKLLHESIDKYSKEHQVLALENQMRMERISNIVRARGRVCQCGCIEMRWSLQFMLSLPLD
jgi:hypothetical protein